MVVLEYETAEERTHTHGHGTRMEYQLATIRIDVIRILKVYERSN